MPWSFYCPKWSHASCHLLCHFAKLPSIVSFILSLTKFVTFDYSTAIYIRIGLIIYTYHFIYEGCFYLFSAAFRTQKKTQAFSSLSPSPLLYQNVIIRIMLLILFPNLWVKVILNILGLSNIGNGIPIIILVDLWNLYVSNFNTIFFVVQPIRIHQFFYV